MGHYICTTCGTQYQSTGNEPESCKICTDERQYVNPNGQTWTTLQEMQNNNYSNQIHFEEERLYSIKTSPSFGIGQTAYLIQTKGYNVLWDCLSYIDNETVSKINELGGIDAIALSHPHFYSSQVEWAEAFHAPIYIHEDDEKWVSRSSERIQFWSGDSLKLKDDVILHRLGGHFKGSAVLEWKNGNNEKGILFTGDTFQVVADRNWVTFMYSYPNSIPLPAFKVKEMAARANNFHFDRLYNAFHGIVQHDAYSSVQKSAQRYIEALEGRLFHT